MANGKDKKSDRMVIFFPGGGKGLIDAIQEVLKASHEGKLEGAVLVWRQKDAYPNGTTGVFMYADAVDMPLTMVLGMLSYAEHKINKKIEGE